MSNRRNSQPQIVHRIITSPARERLAEFQKTPSGLQGFVLLRLPKPTQKQLLKKLSNDEIRTIINRLDPDEATDLLQNISQRRARRILHKLAGEIREKVEFLLRFDPRTAAGIMNLNYIELNENITFQELSQILKKFEKKSGRFPTILFIENGILKGEIPLSSLALAEKKEKVKKYLKKVPSIKYNRSEKEIINTFKKHPHSKLVVLDKDKSILGIIYSDDVLKLLERQSANNLRQFAGVSQEEDVLDPALIKVKNRYRWLIINLATAFLAAGVVSFFQDTISKFVLLAVYMPIVAGMGGNAATQTLAVVVRGLALKEINSRTAKKIIINETLAGAINGIINGALVAIIALLWNKNPVLGLVVALSMIANLIIAGFFGTIIPLLMKKLGKDPAASATVFITTATDVCGFFIFLGLASLLIK